jgi:hypothetical protein
MICQAAGAVARQEVYRLVREAAQRGAAVLVASSDFEALAGADYGKAPADRPGRLHVTHIWSPSGLHGDRVS